MKTMPFDRCVCLHGDARVLGASLCRLSLCCRLGCNGCTNTAAASNVSLVQVQSPECTLGAFGAVHRCHIGSGGCVPIDSGGADCTGMHGAPMHPHVAKHGCHTLRVNEVLIFIVFLQC